MNIKQALDNRIPRVRALNWGDKTYIRLPLTEKSYGPWAEVFDLSIPPEGKPERVLVTTLYDEECEPYTGEKHEAEQNGYSKIYLEQ